MSTYEVYLYGHLLGVFLLLAAAGLSTGTGIAVARTPSAKVALMLLNLMRYSELFVTSAVAILAVVFGSLLVDKGNYEYGDPWVSSAYTLLIVVLAVDHGFLMRRNAKAREMATALGDGPVDEALSKHLNDPLTVVGGVLLDVSFLVFLWLMVAKPGA